MRVCVPAVVLLIAFAAPASAQQPQATHTSVAPSTNVFSKAAIDHAVAGAISTAPKSVATVKTPVPRSGKNFFKTPWPYIIAAGVTTGVLIAVYSGNNNGTNMGPY